MANRADRAMDDRKEVGSVKICETDCHDRIVHDSGECPLCASVNENDNLQAAIKEHEETIRTLEGTIKEREQTIQDLNEEVARSATE